MQTRKLRRLRGVVLFAVMSTVAALGILAGTLAVLARTDLRIAAHFLRGISAFYAADAGVNHVLARLQADLATGTVALSGPSVNVNYTAPQGYTFDPVRTLTCTSDTNNYLFRVTGRAATSRDTLEVVCRQSSVFEMGVFGGLSIDGKNSGGIYTYDSAWTSSPTPADSRGGAVVGSNGDGNGASPDVRTYQNTYIDGTFLLGQSVGGTSATWGETPSGGSALTGGAPVPSDRIDPDPLGVVSGNLAAEFVYYSVSSHNSNSSVSPPINNDLNIKNKDVVTLTTGNYYIRNLTIMEGGTLTIVPSSGPVNIYLTGQLEAKNSCTINFTGDPPDLNIYSNSDKPIILKNSGAFRGTVYAPLAAVQINNGGDFYGIVWGKTLDIKNSGNIYVDTSAMRKHLSNRILLVSWKELLE
jgi:hypothetical protein